jgi:hypothetical protein
MRGVIQSHLGAIYGHIYPRIDYLSEADPEGQDRALQALQGGILKEAFPKNISPLIEKCMPQVMHREGDPV